jgi:hypothetical protein
MIPPILSTDQYRHLVLDALNAIATNGQNLGNVLITNPLADEVLARNSANTLWINKSPTPFTLSAGTGLNNLGGSAGTTSWFNGQGASYSVAVNGGQRAVPILESGTLKKIVVIFQQQVGATVGTGGVFGIRIGTTNTNLISGITTTADDTFYTYTLTLPTPLAITAGQTFVWYLTQFSAQPTNLRSMVTAYFYK